MKTDVQTAINRVLADRQGNGRVQQIRVLGELAACGLTKAQYAFLSKSAGMSQKQVQAVLRAADDDYDQIKAVLR